MSEDNEYDETGSDAPTVGPDDLPSRADERQHEAPVEVSRLGTLPRTLTHENSRVLGRGEHAEWADLPLWIETAAIPGGGGVRELGHGASGFVVRGSLAGRVVAVKIYYREGEKFADRELQYALRDFGPRVARAYLGLEVEPLGGGVPVRVLVTEYVPGLSLQAVLAAKPAVPAESLERWMNDVLDALIRTAGAGVAFRDLKPANVMLDDTDWQAAGARLIDPGGAKQLSATSTDPGIGTYAYAAPEALINGMKTAGPAADVWAMGVTFLAVLLGTPYVFDIDRLPTDPTAAIIRAIVRGHPRLDQVDVPARVLDVLRGALVKNPDERPTAHHLKRILQGAVEPDPAWDPAVPFGPDSVDPQPSPSPLPAPRPVRAVWETGEYVPPPPPAPEPALGTVVDADDWELLFDPAVPGAQSSRWLRAFGLHAEFAHDRWERSVMRCVTVALSGYTVYAVAGCVAFGAEVGAAGWQLVGCAGAGVLVACINTANDISLLAHIAVDLRSLGDTAKDFSAPLRRGTRGLLIRGGLRVLVAVVFALGVGEPVNLFLFNRDVHSRLEQTADVLAAAQIKTLEANYDNMIFGANVGGTKAKPSPTSLTGLDATDRAQITFLKNQPTKLNKQALADGAGGSGLAFGCGPKSHCQELLGQSDAAAASLKSDVAKVNAKITARAVTEADLLATERTSEANAKTAAVAGAGFLQKEQALLYVISHSGLALFRYLIVVVMLFLLEMFGVLGKLLLAGGPYEQALARWTRQRIRAERLRSDLADHRGRVRFGLAVRLTTRVAEDDAARKIVALDVQQARDVEGRAVRLQEITLAGRRSRAATRKRHQQALLAAGLTEEEGPASVV